MSFSTFGEKIDGYKVNVFNEREVRASAGILFIFAMVAFLNSWLVGDFHITRWFVIVFLVEFFIRLFINPRYAPFLILGKFIVKNQEPEYSGAPQKRWAWFIGFILAIFMFFFVVINDIKGPINLLVCLLCLTFLFFESSFGICIGCKIYNLFNKVEAQNCPGNSCQIKEINENQKVGIVQIIILIIFSSLAYLLFNSSILDKTKITPIIEEKQEIKLENKIETLTSSTKEIDNDCTPPQWAIDMGHGEKWKLHHRCK